MKQHQPGITMTTEGLEQALSRYFCQRVEHVEEVAAVCVCVCVCVCIHLYAEPQMIGGSEGQGWTRGHR